MAPSTAALLAEAQMLPVNERLALVEAIWDSIAHHPDFEAAPLPEWQREELDRRLADAEAHPEDVCSWEEVRERLLQRERHG